MNPRLLAPLLATTLLCASSLLAAPADVKPEDQMTTRTGLKYSILKQGEGAAARAGDAVSVHYTGWLADGHREFDNSRTRDVPFQFPLGDSAVIPGFEEGVTGMKVGEVRQLVIPPDLAYGEREVGNGLIPANSTLIFEIELLRVIEVPASPSKVEDEKFVTSETGLKHAVLKPGEGRAASNGKTVAVHYTGWLENGTRFDSSIARGEPIRFRLGAGQVIRGWDEGLLGMKVGEKRQFRIPPALGYGAAGRPPVIPPNSTLIFDVELVDVTD